MYKSIRREWRFLCLSSSWIKTFPAWPSWFNMLRKSECCRTLTDTGSCSGIQCATSYVYLGTNAVLPAPQTHSVSYSSLAMLFFRIYSSPLYAQSWQAWILHINPILCHIFDWLFMTSHGNSPALHFVLYEWSLLTVLTCGSKPTKLGSGKVASWLVFSLGLSLWGSHQFLDAEESKKVRFNERKVAYLPTPVILSLYLSYLWQGFQGYLDAECFSFFFFMLSSSNCLCKFYNWLPCL